MFNVLELIKTVNWEGALIERDNEPYITNGVCLWKLHERRVKRLIKIDALENKELFKERFNKYIGKINI